MLILYDAMMRKFIQLNYQQKSLPEKQYTKNYMKLSFLHICEIVLFREVMKRQ